MLCARKLVTASFALGLFLSMSALAGQSRFSYPSDSEFVVLDYREIHARVPWVPTLGIQVHGDGSTRITLRDKGIYELSLQPIEIETLLREIEKAGLFDLDLAATREEAAFHRNRAGAPAVADATTHRLTVRLDEYRGTDSTKSGPVLVRLSWPDLLREARKLPDASGLQRLAESLEVIRSRSELWRARGDKVGTGESPSLEDLRRAAHRDG